MKRTIAKSLSWDGSIIVEPRKFDLLAFFVSREGLRVSKMFAELLPWVVYTHHIACGPVCSDRLCLRRTIRQTRLRKELPIRRTFRLTEGLGLIAALVGEQFGGREGWLSLDGSLNVFLMALGGQVLAVSVSCLDDEKAFFIDDWWLLIDQAGPLRAGDRVFSPNPSKPPVVAAGGPPAYLPANDSVGFPLVERRAVKRGCYRVYGLGGHSLQIYLNRHTVKRFRKCLKVRGNVSAAQGAALWGIG
jgi:hypothetical protein